MDMDRLYDSRNLGVTMFRAVFVTLALAVLATMYLASISSLSARYGGASMLLVAIVALIASLVVYVPANRQIQAVTGTKTAPIFRHQFSEDILARKGERDLLDRLEKDF